MYDLIKKFTIVIMLKHFFNLIIIGGQALKERRNYYMLPSELLLYIKVLDQICAGVVFHMPVDICLWSVFGLGAGLWTLELGNIRLKVLMVRDQILITKCLIVTYIWTCHCDVWIFYTKFPSKMTNSCMISYVYMHVLFFRILSWKTRTHTLSITSDKKL